MNDSLKVNSKYIFTVAINKHIKRELIKASLLNINNNRNSKAFNLINIGSKTCLCT